MKSLETKRRFIELRAEGFSYSTIARELSISKSTCQNWELQLSNEIENRREEALEDAYAMYGICRAARIKRIGTTLQRIDEALEKVDFDTLTPEQLLSLKLKYTAALKDEVKAPELMERTQFNGYTAEERLYNIEDIQKRLVTGQITEAQAKAELELLASAKTANNLLDYERETTNETA